MYVYVCWSVQALRSHADPLGRLQKRTGSTTSSALLTAIATTRAAAVGPPKRGRPPGGAAAIASGSVGNTASRAAAVIAFRRCLRPLTLSGVSETFQKLITSRPPGQGGGGGPAVVAGIGGDEDDSEGPDLRIWATWTVLPIRYDSAVLGLPSRVSVHGGIR